MSGPIEFYFDFSSPYAYFAAHKIDRLAAEFGRETVWKPFLLGVAFKVSGNQPLVSQPLKGDYCKHDWERLGRYMDLPWIFPDPFPVPTQIAGRAFYWIEGQKGAEAAKIFAKAVYHKYFGEGVNIQSAEMVAEIAAAQGIDRAQLLAAVETPEVKQRLKDETDGAIRKGIFGSPMFAVDGELFWGADRIWMIKHWLKRGGW